MINLVKNSFPYPIQTLQKLCNFLEKNQKLSMGDYVNEFENKFSRFQNRKYSVMVNSGGSANLLLLQSYLNLGYLKKGDRVGFSSLTWSTNLFPIIQIGLIPVPIDVNIHSFNCEVENIEKENIKAFFSTNVLGWSGNLDKIKKYCQEKNILFFEDNCESLGSEYLRKKTGNFGDASTFSFFVGHQFSTIEGGMIATDNEELYEMLKISRANGWIRNLENNRQNEILAMYGIDDFYKKYVFIDIGFNLRPTEINGFLGKLNIRFLNCIVEKRQKLFYEITDVKNDKIKFPENKNITKLSAFCIPILCKNENIKTKLFQLCQKNQIECRPIIAGNITRQPVWKKYIYEEYDLPNADQIHDKGIYLPLYPEMNDEEKNIIREVLEKL